MKQETFSELDKRQTDAWKQLSENQVAEIRGNNGVQTPEMAARFSIQHQVMRETFEQQRERHPESKMVQHSIKTEINAHDQKIEEFKNDKARNPEHISKVTEELEADQMERRARLEQLNEFDPTKQKDKGFGY